MCQQQFCGYVLASRVSGKQVRYYSSTPDCIKPQVNLLLLTPARLSAWVLQQYIRTYMASLRPACMGT